MSVREEFLRLIEAPLVTEKSERLSEKRQYAFKVSRKASKPRIKQAIELAFKVQVESVWTCTVKSKRRRFRGVPGKTASWKKAYVRLSPDSSPINMGSR